MSRHRAGEITDGILHSTRTSASRRCCSAVVQHHTKDLFGSVPLITSNWAVTPFLSFIFFLYLFFNSWSLSVWHEWPSGRELQEMGMEQCGLLRKHPITEGNSRGAECASKDILVLISQVTVIN